MIIYYKKQNDSEYTEITKELQNGTEENISEQINNLEKLTYYDVYIKIYDSYNNLIQIDEREVSTGEGDSVDSWLACIGNTNSQGYSDNNLDTIIDNTQLITELFNSETACDYLVKSTNIILPKVAERIINDKDVFDIAYSSTLRNKIEKCIVYNANTLIGTAGGRSYYKRNDGIAIAATCKLRGAEFIIVSKNSTAAVGYSSYNTRVNSTRTGSFQYENETYYYALIDYGWENGAGVSSSNNAVALGTFGSNEAAARALLDYYFHHTKE